MFLKKQKPQWQSQLDKNFWKEEIFFNLSLTEL